MRCPICNTAFRKIEASLICENGHTIQNTLEVNDDDVRPANARGRALKKKAAIVKTEEVRNMDDSVALLLIYYALFYESMNHFGFSDDFVFKQFTGFFCVRPKNNESATIQTSLSQPSDNKSGTDKQTISLFSQPVGPVSHSPELQATIYGDLPMNIPLLISVIYISKRTHEENLGNIYLLNDFLLRYYEFNLNERAQLIIKKQKLKQELWFYFISPYSLVNPLRFQYYIQLLANFNRFGNIYDSSIHHDTGIISEYILNLKQNLRHTFRRDIEIWMKYFYNIIIQFGIDENEEMLFYFRKTLHTLHPRYVYVPEVIICQFLALFMESQGAFENTLLEQKVLNFMRCSKMLFLRAVNSFSCLLDWSFSPEIFIRQREFINADVFARMRSARVIIAAMRKKQADKKPKKKKKGRKKKVGKKKLI